VIVGTVNQEKHTTIFVTSK